MRRRVAITRLCVRIVPGVWKFLDIKAVLDLFHRVVPKIVIAKMSKIKIKFTVSSLNV